MRIVLLVSFLAAIGCSTQRTGFDIGLIGDAPYSPKQEEQLKAVVEDMNREDLAFVFHVGDFQVSAPGYREGIRPCTDEALVNVRNLLGASRHPVMITPGDNDWTDCHETKPPTDPGARLSRIRELLFSDDALLGSRSFPTETQAGFPEHRRWERDGVLFVTVHIVGSNDNLGRTPDGDAEHAERSAAALQWLGEAFTRAKARNARAMMILTHANPHFEDRWPAFYRRLLQITPPPAQPTAFAALIAFLEKEVDAFGRPVAFVHGDSHYFRVDKPLFREKRGTLVANFTRIETFGSPYVHWVRVHVEPEDDEVFSFQPQIR